MHDSHCKIYLESVPLGVKHVLFTESGNHYTWRQVGLFAVNRLTG